MKKPEMKKENWKKKKKKPKTLNKMCQYKDKKKKENKN